MRSAAWIAVWCCFIARALFYCSSMPMWEGFDEYAHFATIQHVALRGAFPDFRTDVVSRQVIRSLELAPVPWIIRDRARGLLSHDEFWRLPAEERTRREIELRNLPAAWAAEDGAPQVWLWEAQQPPLYYWSAAIVYRAIRGFDLPTQVWILRELTALAASLVVPCAFFAARRVFPDDRIAIAASVLIASMPQLLLSACRVSNEGLAIALGAAVVLLGLDAPRRPLLFGAALGAALLTKAYFLALIPWAAFVLLAGWRKNPGLSTRRAMLALGLCFAICAWWYARTWLLTGTVSGEVRAVAIQSAAQTSILGAVVHMPWRHTVDFAATSYIWLGGWSFVAVRRWMYRAIEALIVVAIAGVIPEIRRREIFSLAAMVASLFAGLAYHAITGYRSTGDAATMGYYLYCIVIAEAILMIAGIGRWIGPRWSCASLIAAFLSTEIFGLFFYLLPYWSGTIQHDASGNLHAMKMGRIGWSIFENLAVNKPGVISAGVLAALAIIYGFATLYLAASALRRSFTLVNG